MDARGGYVNVSQVLASISTVDIVIGVVLCACFVLGFAQGAVRRLLGIGSMVFSFFVAAQAAVPVGGFLAQNWVQWPPAYSVMLGFLTLFGAAVVAFSLVIQGTYRKTIVFARFPIIDELAGGFLGVVQGFMLLAFLVIVLDQAFLVPGMAPDSTGIPMLRDLWAAVYGSGTGSLLHDTVIPGFLGLVQFLIPQSFLAVYGLV